MCYAEDDESRGYGMDLTLLWKIKKIYVELYNYKRHFILKILRK